MPFEFTTFTQVSEFIEYLASWALDFRFRYSELHNIYIVDVLNVVHFNQEFYDRLLNKYGHIVHFVQDSDSNPLLSNHNLEDDEEFNLPF